MLILLIVLIFALVGAPVFAIMAGATLIAWQTTGSEALQHARFIAPDVLDERFAGSPILVTVPLFTFVGYTMAQSKAPERIVRAANALFGWLPGGLAIVCIIASAFFCTLTGGSAVTIVAVGGLLYPALLKNGYPKDYSLGVIMTGGSLGLLLPPSLPILIYSLVAGIDFTKAFKAGVAPGVFMIALFAAHAMWVGVKHDIPRTKPNLKEMASALWELKWELCVPVLVLGSLGVGLATIDESAALAAVFVTCVEFLIHKHLKLKDLPRIVGISFALAGALLLIMAMAVALTNYLITEDAPAHVFAWITSLGVTKRWHFLVARNFLMFAIGAVMEGFSAILVAVPLLIPFGAKFLFSPFHLAMMFLLDLEIAFLSPPFGQNLFVTSFRFRKPMTSLYRIAMPFLGIMFAGLTVIMLVPKISTIAVEGDIAKERAEALARGEPPRSAWLMECVQEDRNNPLPCTDEDRAKWGHPDNPVEPEPAGSAAAPGGAPSAEAGHTEEDEALLDAFLADDKKPGPAGSAAPAPSGQTEEDKELEELLGDDKKPAAAGSAAPAGSAPPSH
ncbi:MAG TPA: TRAP transporter large permease [Polyangiaceae bacterium]|nr:TRAP transporter large permease [Polyangiaceae bacterium]